MDSAGIRRLWDATKTFLLPRRSRDAFVFAFFVLLSALFWLMQTLNGTFEMELHYAMLMTDVPENVVITSDLPPTLDVTVRDKGTSLLRYLTRKPSAPITVDFDDHDEGVLFGHVVIPHADLMAQINASLLSSTRVVTMKPDTLEYFYCRGQSKLVAVVPRGHIETAPLQYLAAVTCHPDSVTVWGPPETLDTLSCITTAVNNMSGLTESASRQVALNVPRGLKVAPKEVMVTAEVDMFTEKTVEVPIVGTNFPAGYLLRTFPRTASVTFRVGAKDYKSITADNFVITTTYEELISQPATAKLRLQLRSLPEGVSQVRIAPEEVDFLIEHSDDE